MKIFLLQKLNAEAIFLNTCSGICFANRKYDLSYDSLSDLFMNGKGMLFISNYMIGAYTHDETLIFFAMLVYYKNFALALYKYNLLVNCFYKKNKAAVMLGDVAIKAIVTKEKVETYFEIVLVEEMYAVIKFSGELLFNTVTFEIEKSRINLNYDLLESILIDKNNKCDYKVGILSESDSYKIFIYCENKGLFETEIIFVEKNLFSKWSLNIYKQLENYSKVSELFLLDSRDLKRSCTLWKEKVYQNIDIQEMDKGNLEITTFAYNILKKASTFIKMFNSQFLNEFIKEALGTDTHLILDNKKFLLKKINSNTTCSICKNKIYEMQMEAKSGVGKYIQYVCPECEILCISNDFNKMNLKLECIGRNYKIYLSKESDFISPIAGAMLINTDISTTKVELVDNRTLMLNLCAEKDYLVGIYYLRIVVFENEKITILHRRIYFS